MSDVSDADARVLRLLINEVRASSPPPVDWDALERRTLATIDAQGVSSQGARWAAPKGFAGALGFAVAAAALVLIIQGQRVTDGSSSSSSSAAIDLATFPKLRTGRVLASAIAPGARVVTTTGSVPFEWPGVAVWELGPRTSAVMTREGGAPTVVLEHGSVRVQAVSRRVAGPPIESFVVEAAGVRVAVHGTAFSVEISGDRVLVEVSEGAVSVGSSSRSSVPTDVILEGPARAAFSSHGAGFAAHLDGSAVLDAKENIAGVFALGPPAHRGDAPNSVPSIHDGTQVVVASSSPAAAVFVVKTDASGAVDPGVAAPREPEPMTLAAVRRDLLACVAKELKGAAPSLSVTVSTDVHLRLDDDRRVTSVSFTPPLRGELQAGCAALLLGRVLEKTAQLPSIHLEFAPR